MSESVGSSPPASVPTPMNSSEPTRAEEAQMEIGAGFNFADPNSRLAPLYCSTPTVVAIAFLAFLFTLCSYIPLWHTDIWAHLKYGEWMVKHGRIPDREPFVPWWDGRQEFTQFYTVSQLVTYLFFQVGKSMASGDEAAKLVGGVELVRVLHGLLTVLRYLLLYIAFRRMTGSPGFALLGLFGLLMMDLTNLAVFRPQFFAQAYFAILLLLLSSPVLSRGALFTIPLLFCLWANSHGSFLVGIVFLGIVFVGRCLEAGSETPRRWPWKDLAATRLFLAIVLASLGVMLNPYGPDLYRRAFLLTMHPSLTSGISEWQPLRFDWVGTNHSPSPLQVSGWHWVFLTSLALVIMTQLASRKTFRATDTLLVLAFGIGFALQTRFVVWWGMIIPWIIIPLWANLWRESQPRKEVVPPERNLKKTLLAVMLVWAVMMWSGIPSWAIFGNTTQLQDALSSGTPWKVAMQLRYPENDKTQEYKELNAVLKQYYPQGRFTGSIMASPMQGEFLLWALAPQTPVTYSHIHLFHESYWTELGKVAQASPGWWEILDKYNVNMVVIEPVQSPRLREVLMKENSGWKVILDEMHSEEKSNPLNRQFIAVRMVPRT